MSSPDLTIDPRFDHLAARLRAAAPPVPAELRERVRALGAEGPRASLRNRLSIGRAALVLAGAVLAASLGVAAVHGLVSAGGGERRSVPRPGERQLAPAPATTASSSGAAAGGGSVRQRHGAFRAATVPPLSSSALQLQDVPALPPSSNRLQQYAISMRLRVHDQQALSHATNKAMRWTRDLGGFVASVRYSSGERGPGDATLILRIPVGRAQQAISRFSSMGRIVSQHVAIQDLQGTLNQAQSTISSLRISIARIRGLLADPSLPLDRRYRLEEQLRQDRGQLAAALRTRNSTLNRGRLTTVALALTTRKAQAAAAKPHERTRLGRAGHDALHFLAGETAILLYALIVLSPLLVLVALALAGRHVWRRREEERLLAAQ